MFRSIVLLVGGLASLSTVSLFAQEAVLGQEYGSGVQAYFAGDTTKAYERLTSAIDHGSQDPRAFYFRGLAYLKLGRPQEAADDFRKGSELESKDVNRSYDAGRALERVQGAARLELENYRDDARMAALEEVERQRKLRYEAIQREEERVLREQAVAAPPKAIEPDDAGKAAEAGSPNPFDAPGTGAAKKGGDAKPAPTGEDPFNPTKKPDAKPPAAKKGGLLGAMGKAAGSAAAGKKATPGAKPAAEKPPADNPDPFAPDAGGAKKPAGDKKPADNPDPFAPDAGGAKKPAGDKKPAKPADKKPSGDADPFAP